MGIPMIIGVKEFICDQLTIMSMKFNHFPGFAMNRVMIKSGGAKRGPDPDISQI